MLGYLGPDGTFSHMAAMEYAAGGDIRRFPTIYSIICAVNSGEIDEGIVPIENSIEGSINTTLDALAFDVDLYIVAEHVLKIRENILIKKGADKSMIKKIMSHPQPIGQCSRILNSEFQGVDIEFTNSTAEAGQIVAGSDGSIACVGPASLAETYGLEILYADCSDENNNATRFVVVSRQRNMSVTAHDKTSIVFSTEHKPGGLYKAIKQLATDNINMLKIESRPSKTELGTYVFFIDIEGNTDDPTIYFALDKLKGCTIFYKLLGSYPAE